MHDAWWHGGPKAETTASLRQRFHTCQDARGGGQRPTILRPGETAAQPRRPRHSCLGLTARAGAPAIIKPFEANDELLSFDALYDTCITAGQDRRIRKAKVSTVEDLPLHLYAVEFKLEVDLSNPGCILHMRAASDVDGRARLMVLAASNAFRVEFAVHVMRRLIDLIADDGTSDETTVLVGGLLKIDELPPPDTPDRQVMPDDA